MIKERYKFELFIDVYEDSNPYFYGKILASGDNNGNFELLGTAVNDSIDKVFDRLKDFVCDSYKAKGAE